MRFTQTVGALTLLLGLGATGVAPAADTGQHYVLAARIIEKTPGTGEFDGTLKVSVSADGIISGYYFPSENPARPQTVDGAITNAAKNTFWLRLNDFSSRPVTFNGTFANGTIHAYAQAFSAVYLHGDDVPLELVAQPLGTPHPPNGAAIQ